MIVVIDGYNLLRTVFFQARGRLQAEKKMLIQRLGNYFAQKRDSINSIILVFDGGELRHATREIHNRIVIISSGTHASADDWIIQYIKKHASSDLVLVTMDRALKRAVAGPQINFMDCEDFWRLVTAAQKESVYIPKPIVPQVSVAKKMATEEDDFPVAPPELDSLMEEASVRTMPKDQDEQSRSSTQRSGQKTSRVRRHHERILKKM